MLKKAKVIYYLSDTKVNSQKVLIDLLKSSNIKSMSKEDDFLKHLVSFFPPGTIFAQSYGINNSSNVICFPLMSSHISLPLKQGEFVWYMSDDDSKVKRENASEVFQNHPLFIVNDYWISRVHGSLLSEDLNYSYKERDSIVSGEKVLKDPKKLEIKIPDFDNTRNIFTPGATVDQNISTKDLYEKGRDTYFGDKATPRMFSKTDDLTIQGSYNTLLNFTSTNSVSSQSRFREGLIDIVSGRLSLQDFVTEEDNIVKLGKRKVKNAISLENKAKDVDFNLHKEKFLEIKNTSGGTEIFKNPTFYLNEINEIIENNESIVNYNSDASRIMISESMNVDNDEYYDVDFLEESYDYPEYINEDDTSLLNIDKEYLKNSIINIKNAKSNALVVESFIDLEDDIEGPPQTIALPTILLKSNNIRIVARRKLENDKNSIPSGNIRLVKEDDKFLNYSHILMENDGNVSIEGRAVKIGDFRKEFMKIHNIDTLEDLEENIENNTISIEYNNDLVKKMHGNGYGVLLGYEEKLSEPLVLGNTLNAVLNEIINITSDSLKKVSEHVKSREDELNIEMAKLNTWISSVTSIIGVPMAIPMNQNYNSDEIFSKLENHHKRLESIQNNLSDILSRFSKTS